MKRIFFVCVALAFSGILHAQSLQLALLKYQGGGDWYANMETSLPNLIRFCNKNIGTNIREEQAVVEAGGEELFNYPFVHMTGHGNVVFSMAELENLRNYLLGGGFLHIDDNYGMDPFIRIQIDRLFPDKKLIEIPLNHPIFSTVYPFPSGLPKIHEHDNNAPKAFGLFEKGRLICLYTFESDLGDGWEDTSIHNDSEEKHIEALKMGANLIHYVFSGEDPKPVN